MSAWRQTNLGRRRSFLLPSCRKSLSTTRRIFMYVGFSCIVLMHKACTCLLGGREKSKYMLKTAATPPKITPRTWMQWGAARDVHTPSYQQVLSQTGTAQKKKQNEPHPKKLSQTSTAVVLLASQFGTQQYLIFISHTVKERATANAIDTFLLQDRCWITTPRGFLLSARRMTEK